MENAWVLTTNGTDNIVGRALQTGKETFILGKHLWNIEQTCGSTKINRTMNLTLSGCRTGEFTCRDGQCIGMRERCDQVAQCMDASDEDDCTLVVLKKGYNKKIAPIVTNRVGDSIEVIPVPVNISIHLLKVVGVQEVEHTIQLQFTIKVKWRENRAWYHNLKSTAFLNILSDEEMQQLWLPNLIYDNTDQKETIRLGSSTSWEFDTTITVQKEGDSNMSPLSVTDEIEIFEGSENSLLLQQTYTKTFQCQYQLHYYPLDTQVCYMNISLLRQEDQVKP